MQDVKEILDSILSEATYRVPFATTFSQGQLHEILSRDGWPDEEMIQAQRAAPHVPGELMSQLCNCLRHLLNEFVDPGEDTIGHALPIGPERTEWNVLDETVIPEGQQCPPTETDWYPKRFVLVESNRRTRVQDDMLMSFEAVSSLEDFAKGLIKGAVVLGTDKVLRLLSNWTQGEPVAYTTKALLNALPVEEPLYLKEGINLTTLPLYSDKLPANLPRIIGGLPVEGYLDRTILSIESTASPALFRPQSKGPHQIVRADSNLNADIFTACSALSLESNSYVDIGFMWNDYQELSTFSLSEHNPIWHPTSTWYPTDSRVRQRPYGFSLQESSPLMDGVGKHVTRLKPHKREFLDLSPTRISRTLNQMQKGHLEKIRVTLTRWIMSKDFEKRNKDKFIDLRIALESLYLKGIGSEKDRGEVSFRLSLYGAWHLGACFEERKRIFETLRGAYGKASRAVHGSNFKDTPETQELLSNAQDLCRRGILKLLQEGPPLNKNDMILGSENDSNSI